MDKPTPNFAFNVMSYVFKLRDLLSPREGILKEVGIQPGFRVLDYGCGPGGYVAGTAKMVGASGKVYALDLHPLAIQRVQNIAGKKQLVNVETIHSDCETGLPDNSVDVVLYLPIHQPICIFEPFVVERRSGEQSMNGMILVVDDEPKIVKQARDYLEKSGFRVITAGDGKTALAQVRHERPDLIVLDLNLPAMDGLDVCRALRRESDVPIIMLTARVEETDRLIGLELGADDYITKPFSPRELVARVRAVLRRVRGGVRTPGLIRAGDLEIDLRGHRLTRAGEPIRLTRSEFTLLATLAQHPGQTFTRAQLLDRLHGVAYDGFDRSIDAHIKNLRRKLEANPIEPRYVLTVYGVGYKFTDEV